jgi:predicted aspartyl protease
VLLVVLTLAPPAAAQLYQWTDADGVTRYTNDRESIPPEYRERAREIDSPQGRPAEPGRPEPVATDPSVIPITGSGPIRASVSINGVPLSLVLDTGADRTVISPAAIARAGLDTDTARPVNIVGVTGSAAAREVIVPLLDVAGVRVGPLPVIVHDVGLADIDGLLGRDVLDRFTLTVDAARGRAILAPR